MVPLISSINISLILLVISHCPLCTYGIIGGVDPSTAVAVRSVVFLDNNSLRNITDEDVEELPIGCSGSVITRYHVLTSGLCCNADFLDQRIAVEVKDIRMSPGKFLPVRDFRIISDMVGSSNGAINKFLSICVLFLAVPTAATPLFLPYEEWSETSFDVFGFGSTLANKRDLYGTMKTATFRRVQLDQCLNEYPELLVNTGISPSFEYLCMEGLTGKRTSLFDLGAPLLDMESSVLFGTAVTLFPNYRARDETKRGPQIFISLLPLTRNISRAIDEMNLRAKN